MLGDTIVRLNDGLQRKLKCVKVRNSKIGRSICALFLKEGLIINFKIVDSGKHILVYLKYYKYRRVPSELKLISRPGLRAFTSYRKMYLNFFCSGKPHGFYVVSTPYGLVTSTESLLFGPKMGEVLLWVSL